MFFLLGNHEQMNYPSCLFIFFLRGRRRLKVLKVGPGTIKDLWLL